jgi:hypothetical protein
LKSFILAKIFGSGPAVVHSAVSKTVVSPMPFFGISSTDFVSASFVLECFFPDHCPRPNKEDQKEEIGDAKWLPHDRDSGGKPVEQDHPTVGQL